MLEKNGTIRGLAPDRGGLSRNRFEVLGGLNGLSVCEKWFWGVGGGTGMFGKMKIEI